MPSESNSGTPAGESQSLETPEDWNQVEVRMESGEVHHVEYVLRHPNRMFAFASKVTAVPDDGGVKSHDLVLKREKIESIESDNIATHTEDADEGTYSNVGVWIHHSIPLTKVDTGKGHKGWHSHQEALRFTGRNEETPSPGTDRAGPETS